MDYRRDDVGYFVVVAFAARSFDKFNRLRHGMGAEHEQAYKMKKTIQRKKIIKYKI